MFARRQQRLRVIETIEARIKQFHRREELWPLRVPEAPLSLDDLVRRAVPENRFDAVSLRSRTLLSLEWDDGSRWEAWMAVLPSGLKIYCDTGDEETRLLASGGRNEGDESDRAFLQLLAESGGDHFGIEMSGGAPRRVRSAIADREFLIGFFVELFEVGGDEESVRVRLDDLPAAPMRDDGRDFRLEVERWLDAALSARAAATSSPSSPEF